MRLTLVSTIIFAVCALIICSFSLFSVGGIIEEAEQLRSEAVDLVRRGDTSSALEKIVLLEKNWEASRRLLEMLIAHDDVHTVASSITDARVCLEVEDIDDFLRASEQLGASLQHIRSVQSVSVGNLY